MRQSSDFGYVVRWYVEARRVFPYSRYPRRARLASVTLPSYLPLDSITDSVTDLVYHPFLIYIEALQPHSIDKVLILDRPVRQSLNPTLILSEERLSYLRFWPPTETA